MLPIPPGTHWSDAKPAVLPGMESVGRALPESAAAAEDEKRKPRKRAAKPAPKPGPPPQVHRSGLWFAPPEPPRPTAEELKAQKARERAERNRNRPKNDPKLIVAARELRDRYIEQINEGLLLPPGACGKYEVSRSLEGAASVLRKDGVAAERRLLDAA